VLFPALALALASSPDSSCHPRPRCGSHPPTMISAMDANGDTASLKRKREPKDESDLSQKKHRRRSQSKRQDGVANANGVNNASDAALQQLGNDAEPADTSSGLPTALSLERSAAWKVSKPMGGRMLDIDPVFSSDER